MKLSEHPSGKTRRLARAGTGNLVLGAIVIAASLVTGSLFFAIGVAVIVVGIEVADRLIRRRLELAQAALDDARGERAVAEAHLEELRAEQQRLGTGEDGDAIARDLQRLVDADRASAYARVTIIGAQVAMDDTTEARAVVVSGASNFVDLLDDDQRIMYRMTRTEHHGPLEYRLLLPDPDVPGTGTMVCAVDDWLEGRSLDAEFLFTDREDEPGRKRLVGVTLSDEQRSFKLGYGEQP